MRPHDINSMLLQKTEVYTILFHLHIYDQYKPELIPISIGKENIIKTKFITIAINILHFVESKLHPSYWSFEKLSGLYYIFATCDIFPEYTLNVYRKRRISTTNIFKNLLFPLIINSFLSHLSLVGITKKMSPKWKLSEDDPAASREAQVFASHGPTRSVAKFAKEMIKWTSGRESTNKTKRLEENPINGMETIFRTFLI